MTVCIAALYENGKGAVLVSDRMVTAHIPIGYEYEHKETNKIIPVDDACSIHALIAGDVLRGNEVVQQAKSDWEQQQGQPSASTMAELMRVAYQKVRLTAIVHTELEPRGLTMDAFYGRHQQLAPQVVQMIDNAMTQGDLGVQILIAGDNDGAQVIYTISNPGAMVDNTAIGYGATGSGASHALASLIEDGYGPSLPKEEVLKMVQQAKTRSEVAPGVGSETNTIVLPKEEANG